MRRFQTESWGLAYEWSGIDEFRKSHSVPDGVHRIRIDSDSSLKGPAFLEFYARFIPSQPLTVHFYGAQRFPRRSREANFGAFRTSTELGTSFVLFHDPTLSLTTDIGIGWYEGFDGFPAAHAIQEVLRLLAEKFESPRTILWGGSAGGYAALRHVGGIADSAALVWNPQTAITRYQKDPVRRYAQVAFSTDDLKKGALGTPGIEVDLTRLPHPNWSDAPVIYLQEADDRHVRLHLSHLLAHHYPEVANEVGLRDTMFGLVGDNLYLHLSHWEPGHKPPPKSAILEFLRRLLDVSTPVAETLTDLESTSHELLRLSKSPSRSPLPFELHSPIRPPHSMKRVLQWGSRFGRATTASAVDRAPFQVSRSILGQSVITAFSIRKSSPPRTAIDFAETESGEHRLTLLRDRRASASAAISDDPNLDFVIIDLLEEVRGTVNAGRGFIVTNHGYLRRVDRGNLVDHEFGSDRHRALWSDRLERLSSVAEESETSIIVIDIDAARLSEEDWVWLNIPEPTAQTLSRWPMLVSEARGLLNNATWIDKNDSSSSIEDTIATSAVELASIIRDFRE